LLPLVTLGFSKGDTLDGCIVSVGQFAEKIHKLLIVAKLLPKKIAKNPVLRWRTFERFGTFFPTRN
jgi:hypothetical protein